MFQNHLDLPRTNRSHKTKKCISAIAILSLLSSSFSTITLAQQKRLDPNFEQSQIDRVKATKYRAAPKSRAIEGQYIVVLKEASVKQEIERMSKQSFSALSANSVKNYREQVVKNLSDKMTTQYGAVASQRYTSVLSGYATKLSDWELGNMLLNEESIDYIEQDQIVTANDIQENATFGLDRIDQSDLPLNNQYEFNLDGSGVDVFVIDTGILASHPDLNGRVDASRGFTAVNDGTGTEDCQGHGTHVAGTVGSENFGVAKNVNLIPIRVLGCDGSGSIAGVIAGVDFVTQTADGPTVANMSLGGGASGALDAAVQNSIDSGITYAVAAGNENTDACLGSPARLPDALTVGATNAADARSGFSNFGNCVDIFAPGSNITSTFNNGDFAVLSGTSMASPHVAGVAALALQADPSATPEEVASLIVSSAAQAKIRNVNGSPNLLLQTNLNPNNDIEEPVEEEPEVACDIEESFENGGGGWRISADSTCSTGTYVVGTPTQQISGGIVTQLSGANTGANAVFTALNSSAGQDDVDGGNCIANSPVYNVSADSTLSMAVFHGQRDSGDDPDDFFLLEVSTDGGNSFTSIASNGDNQINADWTPVSTNVSAGDQVVVRVQCSDGALTGDIIECGIDDIKICNQ